MPYIKQEARTQLDSSLPQRDEFVPATAGELNYCFTRFAMEYLAVKGVNYQSFNDIVGALEGAKLELYRRMIAPYETTKCAENGDVYAVPM